MDKVYIILTNLSLEQQLRLEPLINKSLFKYGRSISKYLHYHQGEWLMFDSFSKDFNKQLISFEELWDIIS